MYRFRSKLKCLFKPVKVTENSLKAAYNGIWPFSVICFLVHIPVESWVLIFLINSKHCTLNRSIFLFLLSSIVLGLFGLAFFIWKLYSAKKMSGYWFRRTSENVAFCIWQTQCCQKSVCQVLSLILVFNVKKWVHKILLIFYTCKHNFEVGMPHDYKWIPWEGGGWDAAVGRFNSM